MAWEPGSSAWDWETDGAIVPGPLTGPAHCKLSISGWEGESSEIKQDRPSSHSHCRLVSQERGAVAIPESSRADLARNGDLCNQVVTPAMANISSSLVFHDAGSPNNLGLMLQAGAPIVTTCVGSGVLLGTYDHASESLESVVQMQYGEINGNAAHEHAQDNAHGRWCSKTMETEVEQFLLSGKQGMVTEVSGRDDLFTSEYKSAGSLCNGRNDAVIDEQHSSSAKGSVLSSDSPTGLQLGKRTYPLDVMSPVAAKTTIKTNGAGKKPRAAASQVPRCQVEGCKLDLSSAKDYHRRHKVCEPHSKAGKVVVASLEQRFCQQCSRFHILNEFDETKRSCRRRLAGHNKRRRKPRPDPLELQAQLRSRFEDGSLFYQSRFSRLGSWQDAGQSRSNILWPGKFMQYYDYPYLESFLHGSGPEMIMGVSSPLTHEKVPLLLLQSPKTVMSTSLSDVMVHNHLPEIEGGGALGNGLRMASSVSGAGVFTNTDTTPVTEVTRVSNSGRALSLLSLQVQCSQALDMVSLDLSGLTNKSINENSDRMQGAIASSQQQFHFYGQPLNCQDFSTNFSINSNGHNLAAADVHQEVPVVTADEDLFGCSFLSNLHRHGADYDGSRNCMALSKQVRSQGGTGQAKQTQDLMQLASFQLPHGRCQSPSTVCNVESSALSEAQFSVETSFLKF